MKPNPLALFLSIGFASSVALCQAGTANSLKPVLAKPGKVLVEDNFSGAQMAKAWSQNKGEWHVQDGAIVGKEKKSDNHPAVLTLNQPNRNSIIQFSFKLDGAKGFALSYNSAKGGHLFRIPIGDDGLSINKDKDKKDAKSRALVLGKTAGRFETGKWYTMLVEVKGDQVVAQSDNGVKVEGRNAGLDVDKSGYRFVTRGETLQLRDLKVWQAE